MPFHRLREGAVTRRHIVAHLHQVPPQLIAFLGDTQHRIERWDDPALRSGFAAKLHGFTVIELDTVINDTIGHRRVVFPAVDIGPDAMIIDVGIAKFWYAAK